MAYDNAPPEINSGSGGTQRDDWVRPKIASAGIVTVIDLDEDGNVTKVPTVITTSDVR